MKFAAWIAACLMFLGAHPKAVRAEAQAPDEWLMSFVVQNEGSRSSDATGISWYPIVMKRENCIKTMRVQVESTLDAAIINYRTHLRLQGKDSNVTLRVNRQGTENNPLSVSGAMYVSAGPGPFSGILTVVVTATCTQVVQ